MSKLHLPKDMGQVMTDLSFVVIGGSILDSIFIARAVIIGWLA